MKRGKIILNVCFDKDFTESLIKTDYEAGSMFDDIIRTGLKNATCVRG